MEKEKIRSKITDWENRFEEHQVKQLINPSSHWEGAPHRKVLSKNDQHYGCPIEGSKTEFQGIKARSHINDEMHTLIDIIKKYGSRYKDKSFSIPLGDLFQLYIKTSNKLVGILLRSENMVL